MMMKKSPQNLPWHTSSQISPSQKSPLIMTTTKHLWGSRGSRHDNQESPQCSVWSHETIYIHPTAGNLAYQTRTHTSVPSYPPQPGMPASYPPHSATVPSAPPGQPPTMSVFQGFHLLTEICFQTKCDIHFLASSSPEGLQFISSVRKMNRIKQTGCFKFTDDFIFVHIFICT